MINVDTGPARATNVRFTMGRDRLAVDLSDGRTILVPVEWFPRLASATVLQRQIWHLVGGGIGIHWPEIDEDIWVDGLLHPEAYIRARVPDGKPSEHG